MIERSRTTDDGGRMRILEQGAGKPIVFTHRWPTNANAWRRQLEGLTDRHRVLAIDLPRLRRPTQTLAAIA
jgi:pimeloyl-ACP methyl ester carboxylesterase